MKPKQLSLLLIAASIAHLTAIGEDFTTRGGTTYSNATVTRKEPDGITIIWRGGVAKLPFSELPADVQEKYDYSPWLAEGYQEQVAEQRRTRTAQQHARVSREARSGEIISQAVTLDGSVLQVVNDGLIIECKGYRPRSVSHTESIGGSLGPNRDWSRPEPGKPKYAFGKFLLVGHNSQASLVDGNRINIVGYPSGNYTYTTVLGAPATIAKYAVTPQLALELRFPEQ